MPLKAQDLKLIFKKGDHEPIYVTNSKSTPFHLKDLAEAEVANYIKNGFLVRLKENECSTWLSPAMFIEKKLIGGKINGVRLVVDFRWLNLCFI